MAAGVVRAVLDIALPQGFPERPVKIIVPLTPGGSPDTIARAIAAGLQGVWTQPVVVENRPGGSQNIGSTSWRSAPDGHLAARAGQRVLGQPARQAAVRPACRLHPGHAARAHPVPAGRAPVAAGELGRRVRRLCQGPPGELNHGSSGNGSPQHLGAAMFQLLTGTKMNHVPYKGAAPAVADLLPGRIQVWIGAANTLLPHIKEGSSPPPRRHADHRAKRSRAMRSIRSGCSCRRRRPCAGGKSIPT